MNNNNFKEKEETVGRCLFWFILFAVLGLVLFKKNLFLFLILFLLIIFIAVQFVVKTNKTKNYQSIDDLEGDFKVIIEYNLPLSLNPFDSRYKKRFLALVKEISSDKKYEPYLLDKVIETKRQELDLTISMKEAELKKLITTEQNRITQLESKLQKLKKEINVNEEQLLSITDELEMETAGLYDPTYTFASSLQYRDKLKKIRQEQKDMVRQKTAAISLKTWTVGGSRREGQKMTNQQIRQILRSFNNECSVLINKVTYRNYDSTYKRVLKSAETLNRLNESGCVKLTKDYVQSKLDELDLAYDYEKKKEEEKEILREERERVREEKRLQKEIQRRQKIIKKDIDHYSQMINALTRKIEEEKEEKRKQSLMKQLNELESSKKDRESEQQDLDYREAHASAGYVYIISNIGAFGKDVIKIGVTRRLNPYERIAELSSASVPFRYDVHAMIFSYDAYKLEAELHQLFDGKRVNLVNMRKEFFKVSIEGVEEVLEKYKDLTIDFNKVPTAEEYRKTLKIIEKKAKQDF